MAHAKKIGTEERRRVRREQVAQERAARQEAREAEWAAARCRRVLTFRSRDVTVCLEFGDSIVVDFDPDSADPLRNIEARIALQQLLRLDAERGAPN